METTNINVKDKKSQKKNAGRWTKKQHKLFLKGLDQFGKDWKKIREMIPSRSLTQIRSHAQKYFIRTQTQKYNSQDQYSGLDADSQFIRNYQCFEQDHQKSPDATEINVNHHSNQFFTTLNIIKEKQNDLRIGQTVLQNKNLSQNTVKMQKQKEDNLEISKKNKNQQNRFILYKPTININETDSFFNQLLLNYYQYMISGQFLKLVDFSNKQM